MGRHVRHVAGQLREARSTANGRRHIKGEAIMCAQYSRLALLTALVACVGVAVASAQSAASSTIHGIVKDDTGGALPGVTVTLTSPALQIGQRATTTEADGAYRFEQLPGGAYEIKFELTGFGTFVRNDLQIAIGFTARVDA